MPSTETPPEPSLLELGEIDVEDEFWYYGFAVPYDVLIARSSAYAISTGRAPTVNNSVYLDHKIHRQFVALGFREQLIETPLDALPAEAREAVAPHSRNTVSCYVYAILMATEREEDFVYERQAAVEAAWEMLDGEMGGLGLGGGFRVPHPEWCWGGLKTVFYINLREREEKEREEKKREEQKREEEKREEEKREEEKREEEKREEEKREEEKREEEKREEMKEREEKEQTSNAADLEALESNNTAQAA